MERTDVELSRAQSFLDERLGIKIYEDQWQQEYVESLCASPSSVPAIFVDAEAGTGKTSLAVSIGYMLLDMELIDQIIYLRAPVGVRELGFLPGDIAEKEAPYMQPGLDALKKLDPKNPKLIETLISNDKLVVASTAFLRGVDWDGRKFIIVDEAQNLLMSELQTVLTRPHDSSKVVVIGSSIQCDEKYPKVYGEERYLPFQVYAHHFTEHTELNVKNINLVNNYRGKFSQLADKISATVKYLEMDVDERPKPSPIKVGPTPEESAAQWEKMGDRVYSSGKIKRRRR